MLEFTSISLYIYRSIYISICLLCILHTRPFPPGGVMGVDVNFKDNIILHIFLLWSVCFIEIVANCLLCLILAIFCHNHLIQYYIQIYIKISRFQMQNL